MYNFYPKNKGLVHMHNCLHKLLLIMKLTTLILVTVILHVSASSLAQKITLVEKNAPLVDVFNQISNQTGYDFVFTGSDVQNAKPVTINIKNAELSDVLNQIFKGQPLDFLIENKSVVIQEKKELSYPDKFKNPVQAFAITGKIIDSLGHPVIGASVALQGTMYSILTDNKGNFTFTSVPQGKYMLVATYIGYARLERNIEIAGKDLNLLLILHTSISSLDQIHIIGYSSESRRFSVNSTTVVTAQDIADQPVTNVLEALDGRVPGLVISPSSGVPGSEVRAQIRGQNTLPPSTATPLSSVYNQPLFILDGIPVAAQNTNISALGSFGGTNALVPNSGISPISGLNPNDIESITVLKDADATSIYGSQGANGVILIVTKKGKPGKTQFNIQVDDQDNTITRTYQMLNTQQYLTMRKQAFANDGLTPTAFNAPDLTVYDQNKYTNFANEFFGGSSNNTDMHASLSGGSATSTFITSVGYNKSTYDFPGDYSDNRLTFHSAFHHNSLDHKLTVDFGTDLSSDRNNSSSSPSVGTALRLPPNTPDLIDPAGNLVWNYKGVDISSDQMDAYLKQPAYLQNFLLNSTFNVGYEILPGLKIALNTGYRRDDANEYNSFPLASLPPTTTTTSAAFATNTNQSILIEPQITYKLSMRKGVFNALLGGTYKKQFGDALTQTGTGYTDDALLTSINNATTVTATDVSQLFKYTDVFARLGYVYDNKYIISLTGNRDASSNFGPGRQFANFGSAGLGWIFSQEQGFKQLLPFISYAKLSGNYGTSGTQPGTAYQFNDFYTSASGNTLPFQGTKTFYPVNLYNPDFSWATQKELNVALDFGLFNDKLLINANYYVNRTSNQLVNATLPSQTGFTSVFQNLNATVQNKGLEFTITSTNIHTKNFSWTTSFLISGNRNKLVAFPGLATSPYASQYIIGKPETEVYGFKYKDVNPTTGLFEFYAADGKTVTGFPNAALASQGGDEVPLGDLEPTFQGGLGNTFKYKGLSLMVFFQFSDQNTAPNYLYGIYSTAFVFPGVEDNIPASLLGQFWEKPGDVKPLQRLSTGQSGFQFLPLVESLNFAESSGVYSKDLYVRLKTVSLSYNLPAKWVKAAHMSGCRLFINAENLLTFTGYKFLDPEMPGVYYALPLQRVISGGLSFDF